MNMDNEEGICIHNTVWCHPHLWKHATEVPIKFNSSFEVTNSHSFEVSSSRYDIEQVYKSDDIGEIDDSNAGDYYSYIHRK